MLKTRKLLGLLGFFCCWLKWYHAFSNRDCRLSKHVTRDNISPDLFVIKVHALSGARVLRMTPIHISENRFDQLLLSHPRDKNYDVTSDDTHAQAIRSLQHTNPN